MEVEVRRRPLIATAELRVAAVADRHITEAPVHDQIDEHRERQNAIGDQVAAEPVEDRADERADDDDGEAHLRVEVLPDVKIGAAAHGTDIDLRVGRQRAAERQWNFASAPAASDRRRRVAGAHRKPGIALRTLRENIHQTGIVVESSKYFASTSPTITVKKSTYKIPVADCVDWIFAVSQVRYESNPGLNRPNSTRCQKKIPAVEKM